MKTRQQSVILVMVDNMLSFSSDIRLALVDGKESFVECVQFIVMFSEQLRS